MKIRCLWIIFVLMLLFGCAQAPTSTQPAPTPQAPASPQAAQPAPEPITPPEPPAVNETPIVGGDRDEHGCIGSAGYSWCEVKQKCIRPWEENCTEDKQATTPAAPVQTYSTAKCDYLTESEISDALGAKYSTVGVASPLEPDGCSITYMTSDMQSNFVLQMRDYSGRDSKLALSTLTETECKAIPGYPLTMTLGTEVGEKSCRREQLKPRLTRQVLFVRNGVLVNLGYNYGSAGFDALLKLAKIVDSRLGTSTAQPLAAPSINGPAGRSTTNLEEGVGGRPLGTAGWASNIAINEALKKNKDLKLFGVSSECPDTNRPFVNKEGKITEGAYWRFQYMTPDRSVRYDAFVYKNGRVDVKSEDPSSTIYPITDWKVDSDEAFMKAQGIRSGFSPAYFEIAVGGFGPTIWLKARPTDTTNLLGLSAKTGDKVAEIGFK